MIYAILTVWALSGMVTLWIIAPRSQSLHLWDMIAAALFGFTIPIGCFFEWLVEAKETGFNPVIRKARNDR